MGQRYLIDSNVIIDYAALRLPQSGSDFVEQIFNTVFLISVAVKIEVLGFSEAPDKMPGIEAFLNTATVLALDDVVTQQTIELRRQSKKIKLGDSIIAATAIVHDLMLITRNTKDFDNIEGLNILNPWSI